MRKEEARVAARKIIRARLCQATPIAAHIAEEVAERAAAEAVDILVLNLNAPSSIKNVQIMECLQLILQHRHDATRHEVMHDASESNKTFFDNQRKISNNQLRASIRKLSDLLEIPGLLEGLTEDVI
jgi:hypothetical protein